ncbi:hypothetical protein IC582_004145 [Cucumis melo]|uniref:Uncharacterized protein n=1 Tax=Cucumis melo TaxID=3656 RepID=A0A9I9E7A3_CUCME
MLYSINKVSIRPAQNPLNLRLLHLRLSLILHNHPIRKCTRASVLLNHIRILELAYLNHFRIHSDGKLNSLKTSLLYQLELPCFSIHYHLPIYHLSQIIPNHPFPFS